MRKLTQRAGFQLFALCALVAAPTTAFAHAFVMQPTPRDVGQLDLNLRAHKNGPCGAVPRTGPPAVYTPGQTITVKFQETVAHQGCFQIAFSPANDANFVTLKQIDDPAGMLGTPITETVTLPAGVSCKACTLVVRQLMQGAPCAANANDLTAAQGTYYSCADICVGADCAAADAGSSGSSGSSSGTSGTSGTSGGGTSGASGGPTTTPTDGGGKFIDGGDDGEENAGPPNLRTGEGGGCSVALGATSGISLALTAGLLGLGLLRRRRAKK